MQTNEELIGNIAERVGFKVVEANINEKHKKISIVIYKPSGVTIDDCTMLNDELLQDIEYLERFRDGYDLEVSSPGVERTFKSFGEYSIFEGREIKIVADTEKVKSKVYTGVLKGVDNENNVLIENGYDLFKIPYLQIRKGSLVFEEEI